MDKRYFWNFSVNIGRKAQKEDIINQMTVMRKFFEYPRSLQLYAKRGLPYMFISVEMYQKKTFPSALRLARYGSLGRLSAATCMDLMLTHFNMKKYTVPDRLSDVIFEEDLTTKERHEVQR